MQGERTSVWIEGIERHLEDLRQNAYEGASGPQRQKLYLAAFELLAPVAADVLQQVSTSLLRGKGEVVVRAPGQDGMGGSIGSWLLTWPELSTACSPAPASRTIAATSPGTLHTVGSDAPK